MNGRAGHAYIITGDIVRAAAEAKRIAALMVCRGDASPCGLCPDCYKAREGIHPDITVLESENVEIKIDELRNTVLGSVYIRPNEADRRVFIIMQAQKLNDICQNALLKVLEEPPSYAAFLLVADNADGLLATVRSRCSIVKLPPSPESDAVPQALELLLTVVCDSELSMYVAVSKLEKMQRADFMTLCESCLHVLGQTLRAKSGSESAPKLRKLVDRISIKQTAELIKAVQAARYRTGRYLSLPLVTGALAAQMGEILKLDR